MSRTAVVLWMLPLVGVLAGCGPQAEIGAQQARVIDSGNMDAVFSAAANILRREFGRVHVNPEMHTLVSEPAEYNTTDASGTARDLYRGPSTMRRVAHLNLGHSGQNTVARLRIDIERQDTARVQSTQAPAGGRLSDSPGYTPIERDAATTERQNTVWSFVRRDNRLERELLQELQEQFASPPATQEAAGQNPPERPAGGRP